MTDPRPRRTRGGKRARRAARNQTDPLLKRAAAELDCVLSEHLGPEHDPDGVWGISARGREHVEAAQKVLLGATSDAAVRAVRRLDDFFYELEGWGYVTEAAQAVLEEARSELPGEPAQTPNTRPCIRRDGVGFSEVIAFDEFATLVVGDDEVAERIAKAMLDDPEPYEWNADQPEFIERFTVTDADALRAQLTAGE